MNRRDFLKLTSGVATAAMVVPLLPDHQTSTIEPTLVEPPACAAWAEGLGRKVGEGLAEGIKVGQLVYLGEGDRLIPYEPLDWRHLPMGIATRDIEKGETITLTRIAPFEYGDSILMRGTL